MRWIDAWFRTIRFMHQGRIADRAIWCVAHRGNAASRSCNVEAYVRQTYGWLWNIFTKQNLFLYCPSRHMFAVSEVLVS